MNLRNSLLVIIFSILMLPTLSYSQVIQIGKTMEASSQLIFWYDNDDSVFTRDASIQVTNTSSTDPVEVHIQIYSSTGDGVDVANTVRCIDGNFNDVLTANDTHVYAMDDIQLNNGEAGTIAPIPSVDGTKGFVVVTPVVGNGDNTAISFQHLIGSTYVSQTNVGGNQVMVVSAMGRDAVDLTNGQILAQGTTLDGVSTGLIQIQPTEIVFNVTDFNGFNVLFNFDIVAIVFADEYGPAGLLGYRAVPAESTWSPFLFDFDETSGSCPIATNSCFNNWGLSAQNTAFDQLIDPGINICDAVVLPPDFSGLTSGWSRSFIMGIDPLENQLVLVNLNGDTDAAAAVWANTK